MKKTILLVDDIKINLDFLKIILKDRYNVICATSGKEALEVVKNNKIDLVLLDIVMPEMNGYEVCEVLKKDDLTKHIPVIFITSQIDEDSIIKGYAVGAVDYVTKPYKQMELLAKIKTHLKLKSLIDELEYMATHDTMTDIYNRREFFRLANKIFNYKSNLYVVMIDIDNFKNINDTYGHSIGDKVIKEFVLILKTYIKNDTIFARLGGEEFGLICSFNNDKEIETQIETIRKAVENTCILIPHKEIKFTISIGIAKVSKKHESIEDTLKEADKNLYEAKKNGKNKIIYKRK